MAVVMTVEVSTKIVKCVTLSETHFNALHNPNPYIHPSRHTQREGGDGSCDATQALLWAPKTSLKFENAAVAAANTGKGLVPEC